MWETIKEWAAWVWNWITVITGIIVGLPSVFFDLLDTISSVDLTPLLPTEYAARIIAGVAVAKALYGFYRSRTA